MKNREGTPIWYELMTQTPDGAQDFYGKVMGWSYETMPGMDYRICGATPTEAVAGIMKTPEGAPFGSVWFVYFGVEDVDATAEKIKTLGGAIHMEPKDIPGVGRFAFAADPQGAMFYVMRGESDEASKAFMPMTTGHFCWNELVTSDQNAALEFYGKLFGFEVGGSMSMGPKMGDYTFIVHDGVGIGGAMNAFEEGAQPYWNFAIQVADIDVAKKAIEEAGGTVRMGPHELPNDSGWLIQATDPQGAKIMFSGPRKASK